MGAWRGGPTPHAEDGVVPPALPLVGARAGSVRQCLSRVRRSVMSRSSRVFRPPPSRERFAIAR
jgi:hypothetical protein